MKSLSTLVLYLLTLYALTLVLDYTLGFIRAIKQRIHKRVIRQQRRLANRIVKNY